jgi:hypothetical protein
MVACRRRSSRIVVRGLPSQGRGEDDWMSWRCCRAGRRTEKRRCDRKCCDVGELEWSRQMSRITAPVSPGSGAVESRRYSNRGTGGIQHESWILYICDCTGLIHLLILPLHQSTTRRRLVPVANRSTLPPTLPPCPRKSHSSARASSPRSSTSPFSSNPPRWTLQPCGPAPRRQWTRLRLW